jgi:hypothetical protein
MVDVYAKHENTSWKFYEKLLFYSLEFVLGTRANEINDTL